MKAAAYVLFLFVVLALSVQGYAQVPDDKLIVPGQRIGKWTLDMTIADLVKMNGAENANGSLDQYEPIGLATGPDWADAVYCHGWHDRKMSVCTLGKDSQRVAVIAIFSEDYKTAKGLSMTTPPQDVEALYGTPTANTRMGRQGSRMIYDETGLSVRIFSNAVQVLFVFRPGTAKQIWNFQN